MPQPEYYIAHTRNWLQKIVIDMGLCPFAGKPYKEGKVRIVVCEETEEVAILEEVKKEIYGLFQISPNMVETSLLIVPHAFPEFRSFNDFLNEIDPILADPELDHEIQIATFHPLFKFAGEEPDDPSQYTNRAPYPIFHFLRESSVTEAVDGHRDIHSIPERNIHLMRSMGLKEIKKLWETLRPPIT